MVFVLVNSGLMTLIATARSSISSTALYTVPMPPRPSWQTTRYLPTVFPINDQSTMLLASSISALVSRRHRCRAAQISEVLIVALHDTQLLDLPRGVSAERCPAT